MDEHGHLGYCVWFGLIEIICKETGNDLGQSCTISPTYLRRKLRTSPAKLRQVLDSCRTSGRLMLDYSEKKLILRIPKIAEIKDNYTKDLQASGKKLSLEVEVEEEEEGEEDSKPKKPRLPVQEFFNSWNKGQGISRAKELTKGRREKIKLRLQERSLDHWKNIFSLITASDFCKGRNDRGWKASLDWIIANEDNAVKVLEGKYANTDNGKSDKEQEQIDWDKRERAAAAMKAKVMAGGV